MKDETKQIPHIIKMGDGNLLIGAAMVPIERGKFKIEVPAMAINRVDRGAKLVGLDGTPISGKNPELELLLVVPSIESAEALLKTAILIYEIFEKARKRGENGTAIIPTL